MRSAKFGQDKKTPDASRAYFPKMVASANDFEVWVQGSRSYLVLGEEVIAKKFRHVNEAEALKWIAKKGRPLTS